MTETPKTPDESPGIPPAAVAIEERKANIRRCLKRLIAEGVDTMKSFVDFYIDEEWVLLELKGPDNTGYDVTRTSHALRIWLVSPRPSDDPPLAIADAKAEASHDAGMIAFIVILFGFLYLFGKHPLSEWL